MEVNNTLSFNNINYSGKKQASYSLQSSLNDFVNATDEELYAIAKSKNQQKHKNDTSKFIAGCVGVDAISSAILTSHVRKNIDGEIKIVKAPLSAKIGAGFKSVKGWALGFAAVGALMGVKNAILNKNEKFAEFEKDHPVGTFMGEIGALALGYQGAKLAGGRFINKSKLADKLLPISNKISKIGKKIDNSKVSTFVMNRCSDISDFVNKKAPGLGKTGRLLLGNSVLLMLMAGLLKIDKNNKEVAKTYEDLKFTQAQIRENIF